ncbi:MAG: hypothetical protein JNM89_04100 [Hyphomicrobiaceae bacterium]|nr:hypothetical protein [Hyphomicrobiaceae bacterium]
MASIKGVSLDEIIARGSIGEGDVLRLRSACYGAGSITADEAEDLLRLDAHCATQVRSWPDFLLEVITDYIVAQAEPEGYVNSDNADWLIARLAPNGRVESRIGVEILVNVIDRARWSPERLVRFALAQVRDAVITGTGPLRAGSNGATGFVTEGEVELLRRILYAFGGDGNVAVTRAEAEALFDINDAIADGEPNPAWTDLFVKAIANVVMAASSYAVPTREEALRREAWLDEESDMSPLAILKGVLELPSLLNSYRLRTREEAALDRLERQRIELVVNEQITEGEAQWLAERIGHDGRLTPGEVALIAYLEKESPAIHPELRALVSRLAA